MLKSLVLALFLLSFVSCGKSHYNDLGEIVNFDYRGGWNSVTILTLANGQKISLMGTYYVSTGQHLYTTDKPGFFDPWNKVEYPQQ